MSSVMPSFIGVRHVGLAAKDPAALAAFYRDVLGMTVVCVVVDETPGLPSSLTARADLRRAGLVPQCRPFT